MKLHGRELGGLDQNEHWHLNRGVTVIGYWARKMQEHWQIDSVSSFHLEVPFQTGRHYSSSHRHFHLRIAEDSVDVGAVGNIVVFDRRSAKSQLDCQWLLPPAT